VQKQQHKFYATEYEESGDLDKPVKLSAHSVHLNDIITTHYNAINQEAQLLLRNRRSYASHQLASSNDICNSH